MTNEELIDFAQQINEADLAIFMSEVVKARYRQGYSTLFTCITPMTAGVEVPEGAIAVGARSQGCITGPHQVGPLLGSVLDGILSILKAVSADKDMISVVNNIAEYASALMGVASNGEGEVVVTPIARNN